MNEYTGDLEKPRVVFHNPLERGRNNRTGLIELYAFTPKGTRRTVILSPDEAIALAHELLTVALNEKRVADR